MADLRVWFVADVDVDVRGDEYGYDKDVQLSLTKVNDEVELAKELVKQVSTYGNSTLVTELLKSPNFVEQLDKLGYRDIKALKDASEKLVGQQRYYMYSGKHFYYKLDEINIGKDTHATQLADNDTILLQSIDKASLEKVNKSLFDKMMKEKKRRSDASKAAKKAAATKAEKNKQKQIEKAKKL